MMLRINSHKSLERFMLFSFVGTIGFVVDVAVLGGLLSLRISPYIGQVVAYLVAATVTWGLNRKYTFRSSKSHEPQRQLVVYLGVNVLGGAVNYGVYAIGIHFFSIIYLHPFLGVALGSLSGLMINFIMSKRIVFR